MFKGNWTFKCRLVLSFSDMLCLTCLLQSIQYLTSHNYSIYKSFDTTARTMPRGGAEDSD